jgi:hypothetical protein
MKENYTIYVNVMWTNYEVFKLMKDNFIDMSIYVFLLKNLSINISSISDELYFQVNL